MPIIQGHVLDILKQMESESVQCVVTSPPYWGLRDYGIEPQIWDAVEGCKHEWNELILKGEARINEAISGMGMSISPRKTNPEAFLKVEHKHAFCLYCNAWRGSLGLEPTPELYVKHIVEIFRGIKRVLRDDGTLWLNLGDSYAGSVKGTNEIGLKPKDLCGIPWLVALALRADGWWLRSDIIYSKKNPMPESVHDRPTKSHEYIFLLTKSAKYFFDQDAVREAHLHPEKNQISRNKTGAQEQAFMGNAPTNLGRCGNNPSGRNIRTVWTIATQPFSEAHFATFPCKLVEPCVKAGSREGDTVLDPFIGSGTVAVVANYLDRRWIGIELNPKYIEMALKRIEKNKPIWVEGE